MDDGWKMLGCVTVPIAIVAEIVKGVWDGLRNFFRRSR